MLEIEHLNSRSRAPCRRRNGAVLGRLGRRFGAHEQSICGGASAAAGCVRASGQSSQKPIIHAVCGIISRMGSFDRGARHSISPSSGVARAGHGCHYCRQRHVVSSRGLGRQTGRMLTQVAVAKHLGSQRRFRFVPTCSVRCGDRTTARDCGARTGRCDRTREAHSRAGG